MPREKRRRGRAAGEGSIRRREVVRADGTRYRRYNAVITLGWLNGKQRQLEGPRRATEQEALADLRQRSSYLLACHAFTSTGLSSANRSRDLAHSRIP